MSVLVLVDPAAPRTRDLIEAVEAAGLRVQTSARAAEAEQALRVQPLDGIVFDPLLAGEDFLRRVRRQHPDRRLVAWLDRASSERTADLLADGAAEVVDGTMGGRELAARLAKALRPHASASDGRVDLGGLVVDPVRGEARWRGEHLALTGREREVLHVLAESAGHTVRRESLYRQVWGYAMARGDRSVDVNVKRLRTKLAAAGVTLQISTQPGVGYRLDPATAEPTVTGL